MFNEKTIDRIKTSIYVALGDKDFFTRKSLLEALKRAGLKLSNTQLTRDVQLLSQCQIKGFTHFKYDKGYDLKSCEAIVAYRFLAATRGRAQAVYHLNTIIDLLEETTNYDNEQRGNHTTVECKATAIG
ncbi:hypothetical protein ACP6PL_10375 [Dapis sp. BLCC M126]|uniref:hypothetical protein n=1 Tax=Dapis sp. BLCC M126 TaxID=3400189 RepID=UPI003CE7B8BC